MTLPTLASHLSGLISSIWRRNQTVGKGSQESGRIPKWKKGEGICCWRMLWYLAVVYEKLLFTESEANLGIMLSAGDGYCRVHICGWDPHRNTKYIPSVDRIPSAGLVPIGHCWGSFPRHCAGLALTHSFVHSIFVLCNSTWILWSSD